MTATALVICNTTDPERDAIEGLLEGRNFAPEMFEIDRIMDQQQHEYLNCINEVREEITYEGRCLGLDNCHWYSLMRGRLAGKHL